MVGKETYDAILTELQRMHGAEGYASVKAAHARAAKALGDATHPNIWHETLAYLAESSPKHGLIRRLFTAIKRFLLSLGYPAGRLSEADIIGLIQVAAFTEGKNQGLAGEQLASGTGDSRVVTALKLLGNATGIFRYKESSATSMADISKDLWPGVKVEEFHPPMEPFVLNQHTKHYDFFNKLLRGTHIVNEFTLTLPSNKLVTVTEHSNGMFYVDASLLTSGESQGNLLYHLLSTYAYNNGKVFIGDPRGLTEDGKYRRTQNMASSAVRYGTTQHLMAHPVQDIEWGDDDAKNFENLINKAAQDIIGSVKELDGVVYDFQTRTFRTESTGTKFTTEDFDRVREGTAAQAVRAGVTSLERGVFFRSLAREASSDGGWQRVLASFDAELSDGGNGGALKGAFYSKRADPAAGKPALKVDSYIEEFADGSTERIWAVFADGHPLEEYKTRQQARDALKANHKALTAKAERRNAAKPTPPKTYANPNAPREAKPVGKTQGPALTGKRVDQQRLAPVEVAVDHALQVIARVPALAGLLQQLKDVINRGLPQTRLVAAVEQLYANNQKRSDQLLELTAFATHAPALLEAYSEAAAQEKATVEAALETLRQEYAQQKTARQEALLAENEKLPGLAKRANDKSLPEAERDAAKAQYKQLVKGKEAREQQQRADTERRDIAQEKHLDKVRTGLLTESDKRLHAQFQDLLKQHPQAISLPVFDHLLKAVQLLDELGQRNTSIADDEGVKAAQISEALYTEELSEEKATKPIFTLAVAQYLTKTLGDVLGPLMKLAKQTPAEAAQQGAKSFAARKDLTDLDRAMLDLIDTATISDGSGSFKTGETLDRN